MTGFDPFDLIMSLDEAGLQRLLALDADDPRFEPIRRVLPSALTHIYLIRGRADLLEEAVTRLRSQVALGIPDDDERAHGHASLASALLLDYQRTGRVGTLEEAIAAARESLAYNGIPGDERAGRLYTLGHLLYIRSTNYNSVQDLDRSIGCLEESVAVENQGAEKRAEGWSNLAGALRHRFDITADKDDLDRAVEALENAVRLAAPGGKLKRANTVNLAGAIRQSARVTKDLAKLDESIAVIEAELESMPGDDADMGIFCYSLGMGYLARHELSGDEHDLRLAQATLRSALKSTAAGLQRHADIATDLADALRREDNQSAEALTLLDMVADHSSAAARVRLNASRIAGETRLGAGELDAAMSNWEDAVGLLPIVAWRGSRYLEREEAVGRYAGTANTAAACATALGMPGKALELLEIGRGILWSHLLDVRADLRQVRAVNPDLAGRLDSTRTLLDAIHYDPTR